MPIFGKMLLPKCSSPLAWALVHWLHLRATCLFTIKWCVMHILWCSSTVAHHCLLVLWCFPSWDIESMSLASQPLRYAILLISACRQSCLKTIYHLLWCSMVKSLFMDHKGCHVSWKLSVQTDCVRSAKSVSVCILQLLFNSFCHVSHI